MRIRVRVHATANRALAKAPELQKKRMRLWVRRLQDDVTSGARVENRKIPKALKGLMEDPNLWQLRLAEGWRAIYTIQTDGDWQTVVILFIGTHKQYDRLMGY